MRLVIFGLTISSSWGNGHATIWRGLLRALSERGHSIVFFEKDVPYYAGHRDLWEPEGIELLFYRDWEEMRKRAEVELNSADVAITTSYCPDGMAASDLILASRTRVKCFYDLDTPVTLKAVREGKKPDYIPTAGLSGFDIVLSYTGGKALDGLKDLLGAKMVCPLYGSVDPVTHGPVPPVYEYRADLSYLGTYAEDRQNALEEFFIQPARRLREKRFVIGGALYPDSFPWTGNIYFLRHVPPPAHPAFYSSSAFTLNVTRGAMAETGYCPSGRLFEAAACGVPVLSDWWEGLESFFEPDREVLIVRSADDVVSAMGMSTAERARIAESARERTLSEHTAESRAADFERIMECAFRGLKEETCGG